MTRRPPEPLGAHLREDGAAFLVWAPFASRVELELADRSVAMTPGDRGYHHAIIDGLAAGDRYSFRLDGGPSRPDPASRHQPDGVHAASALVDSSFDWTDAGWRGVPLAEHVIYELHVGTFTQEGTFEAIIPHLQYLRDLGVTAIELMPVAQFPGTRNWGYDGVFPYAVQDSYGGVAGLKRLVDAAHAAGLAVLLDVVYNHLGPEGNYLGEYGPYFTDRYTTPWGSAFNFDGAGSDEVRRFFIESALYYVRDFHIDGFRLDAVHAIVDNTAVPFIEELATAVHGAGDELGREVYLFPESTLNDPKLITRREEGGLGLDAVWNDDFHHALRAALTGENAGYYQDYGELWHVAKAYREGFVYTGEYSAFRGRRHGCSACHLQADSFVVFAQNHDQIGNRALGERLSQLVDFETLKLAAGAVLFSPYIPLLFMGEEYAERAPFQYFISHSDEDLIEAVRKGRKAEFESFRSPDEPPDPQSEETFRRCIPDRSLRDYGRHKTALAFYRTVMGLRRRLRSSSLLNKADMQIEEHDPVLVVRYSSQSEGAAVAFNFGEAETAEVHLGESYSCIFDSASEEWDGPQSAGRQKLSTGGVSVTLPRRSFAVFVTQGDTGW